MHRPGESVGKDRVEGFLTAGQPDAADDESAPEFRLYDAIDIDVAGLMRRLLRELSLLLDEML